MRFRLRRCLHFVCLGWLFSTFFSVYWIMFYSNFHSEETAAVILYDKRHLEPVVKPTTLAGLAYTSNAKGVQSTTFNKTLDTVKDIMGLVSGTNRNFTEEMTEDRMRPVTVHDKKAANIYPATNHTMFDGRVHEQDEDRILQQLRFIPPSVVRQRKSGKTVKTKKIYDIELRGPTTDFLKHNCTVMECEMVNSLNEADVVVFHSFYSISEDHLRNRRGQVWVLYELECPMHTSLPFYVNTDVFNWTATYRHDSTIVAPYEKYVLVNASSTVLSRPPTRNYALGKTKKVAWVVSNCYATNNRMEYAKELEKYIQVDTYGICGSSCEGSKCFEKLDTEYKFYLAFENSNCRDYITEKFFINGLKHDVIPIVMGAAPEDYRRVAPPNSYIHVDDFGSPKDLADYLHTLDQDDTLYNNYFAWKGLWHNINTFFWCRLCKLAHDVEDRGPAWHSDIITWWQGPGVCNNGARWGGWNADKTWDEHQ